MTRRRVLVVRSGGAPFPPSVLRGIEVVEKVSHTIEAVEPAASAFSEAADLAIFTSRTAVGRVLGSALAQDFLRCVSGGRIVAVGPVTAKALAAAGLPPDVVAKGSSDHILESLGEDLAGQSVVLPCGEDASLVLGEGLAARGATVRRVVVYSKRPNLRGAPFEREILDGRFAAWCATSPAAARWIFDGMGSDGVVCLRETPVVALGPSTRRCLESFGVRRIEVPTEPSFAAAARLLEMLATGPDEK